MANLFQAANEIVTRLARRNPEWPSTDPTGGNSGTTTLDPSPVGAVGVSLANAPASLVQVLLRANDGRETQNVIVDTLDLTATYTVTVDSNAVDYDASAGGAADEADVINGIADAINADATVAAIVTATAIDVGDTGAVNTVQLVTTAGDESMTLAVSATGSGVLDTYGDATSLDLAIWLRSKTVQRWSKINNGDYTAIDRDGWVEEIRAGGFDRIYVQVTAKVPARSTYTVRVGNGELE